MDGCSVNINQNVSNHLTVHYYAGIIILIQNVSACIRSDKENFLLCGIVNYTFPESIAQM